MAKNTTEMIGGWSFLIGALIALILGVIPSTAGQTWVVGLLLVLGLIVGFLNVSDREVLGFLIACVAFLVSAPFLSGALSSFSGFGWLTSMLNHIAVFIVPAAVLVAIKAVWALAANK